VASTKWCYVICCKITNALDEPLKREVAVYSETGSYKSTRRHLTGQNSVYVLRYQRSKSVICLLVKNWLICWLPSLSVGCFVDWLVDWLLVERSIGWFVNWLVDWFICSLIGLLVKRSIVWFVCCFVDWSFGYLVGWFVDCSANILGVW
jgi:hypothetical protein